MDTNFLKTVAPHGLNCLTTLTPKPDGTGVWANNHSVMFENEAYTAQAAVYYQSQGQEVYFGLGSYASQKENGQVGRTKDNVVALRSFWLDIDAGAAKYAKHQDKVYPSQQEAINALYAVVHGGHLPLPTYVVSSGEGIHVYWSSVEDIAPAEWRVAAQRLKQFCVDVGLRADPSRTADESSVLRPVGTTHFKSGRIVTILQTNALFHKADLLQRMNTLPVSTVPLASSHISLPALPNMGGMPAGVQQYAAQSSMGELGEYKPASFGKIIEREEYTHDGCRQLTHFYKEQMFLEEPQWYAGLTIAAKCVADGQEWIHKLSNQHPNYSPEETARKAAQVKGPMTCAAIEDKRPGGCDGCPHRGRISSPIVLGYDPAQRPTIVIAQESGTYQQKEYVVPMLPFPYYRGDHGGVYVDVPKRGADGKPLKDTQEKEPLCIVPHDTYLYERVDNTDQTQSFLCRYHSPHDGVRDFNIDSNVIHTVSKEFKDVIVGAGLPITGNERWNYMADFLNRMRVGMVNSKAAVQPIQQMGWQPDFRSFVLGRTAIKRNMVSDAPLQDRNIARKYAKSYQPSAEGNAALDQLDEWNQVLQMMYGIGSNAVPNQFVIATALGAPFSARFALDNHAGGIISLASSGSGHGKTFTCQVALRVWGDPADVTFSSKNGTTANALMTNLGYLNSLPILRDEITEMDGNEVANLAYDSTRLADKERAEGSKNDIRENKSHWRTFFYCTGNNSMYDMVAQTRDIADGPLRRITEITLPKINYLGGTDEARRLAKRLSTIQGVAGRKLMEWFMANEDKAERLWEQTMTYFVNTYGATNEERYWVNHLVSGCVGALIAQKLDLLPFDPMRIIGYAGDLLLQLRQRIGYRRIDTTDYWSQFYTDNTDHVLMVGNADKNENTITATELPRKQVYIRVEQNAGYVYVNAQLIKRWCGLASVTIEEFEYELRRRGGVPAQMKRMLANTAHNSTTPPQKVWRIPIGGLS